MANITPRLNKDGSTSYLIRVFVDETRSGKQKQKSMTWKPAPGMSEKAIQRELNRQATLFEERARRGLAALDGAIRFEDYAERWMKAAQLAPSTQARYEDLLKRINAAIGHIRLDRLQAHHLEEFYRTLRESGAKENGRFAVSKGLDKLMDKKKITRAALAERSGVSASTVGVARRGERIRIDKAERIATALGVDVKRVFTLFENSSGLSDKTILHHHRLISAILSKAKRERIIPFNVAIEHADAPKVQRKEARYLDDEQARHMVDLLFEESDIRIKTALLLLLYSGLRRGELCGLEWSDVNLDSCMIHVARASQYQKGRGITEVPTKNASSERAIKIPHVMADVLREYKTWWMEYRLSVGDRWQDKDGRLFVQDDGEPINPDTINFWLNRFTKTHDLPHLNPHALRHTFATLQIAAGVDLRTLQARTGHAQASTLVNIYSHALKSAAEAATNALDDMLTPASRRGATR